MPSVSDLEISVCRTGPFLVNTMIVPLSGNSAFVMDVGGNVLDIAAVLDGRGLVPSVLVCSHGHFDHVLGLTEFHRRYPDTLIAIHSADSGYLGERGVQRQREDLYSFGLERELSALSFLPQSDLVLNEGDTLLMVPGLEQDCKAADWRVLHTPGHTAGSICLYNEAQGILLSGDTLFYRGYGRTDLYGGDEAAIQKSLARLVRLPGDTVVYPGHDFCAFKLREIL